MLATGRQACHNESQSALGLTAQAADPKFPRQRSAQSGVGGGGPVTHPLRISEDPFLESSERIFARGKVAGSILSHRWRSTPLGDIGSWPLPLVFTLNLVLNSTAPCFIFWGSHMLQFYNDGCLPLLGSKHPTSLGRPASECWAEFWHIIGPQLASVFERGETVTHDHARLPIIRDGLREDTYWNYSL